jgi:hypothetical protein
MAQSNADQPAELVPPPSDRATAEHLGKRVAEAALKWRSGTQAERGQYASDSRVGVGA